MERKVSELLTKKKFENFYALNRITTTLADRIKVYSEILFPNVVFVKAGEYDRSRIRQVEGVINYVYWLDKPVTIDGEDISLLNDFLSRNYNVQLERISVKANERASIETTPALTQLEDVWEVTRQTTTLHFPSLGYALISTPTHDYEIAPPIHYSVQKKESYLV